MAERIGFIGLGRMGLPMASNLQRKGFKLSVLDVRQEPMTTLRGLGAVPRASAAEIAAECDTILTMLPSSLEVEAVILGPDGILANARPDLLVMDMSTVEPMTTDKLAAAAAGRNVAMVDAPVGRLASHADRGECLFMVGATEAGFARVRPLLEAMGTTLHHCGPVGSGTRTKLVNNFLAIVSCQMNAEALALASAFGLELERTLEVIHGTTATNGQLKMNYATKVLSGDIEPGFTIDLAHKDLSLIVNAANALRLPLPVAAAARESLSLARSTPYRSKDFSALLDHWCERAGVPKPRFAKAKV